MQIPISPVIYKNVIDKLEVQDSPKYQQSSSGKTFSFEFVNDVMNAYGYELPATNLYDLFNELLSENNPQWLPITFNDAQTRANQGYPTISITDKPMSTAVIYPSNNVPNDVSDVDIAIARHKCFNNTKLSNAYGLDDLQRIKFYSWFE